MKFILGALGIIFVVILAIVLLTRGGDDGSSTLKPRLVVSEQARDGVSAVQTTQGEVVGDEQRRAIRIIVTASERRLEVLAGYDETVERSSTFPNTQKAFETFLASIDRAGFDLKRPAGNDNENGACPLGKTYIYELEDKGEDLVRLWGTSCSGKQGTFNGNGSTIRTLFEQQIPNYNDAVKGVSLSGNNK